MLKNTSTTYGSLTRYLHWTMGVVILGIIIAGFVMTSMENSDQKWFVYGTHKAFGVIILALIPLRLIWRLVNPQPALPKNTPAWQEKLANVNIMFEIFWRLAHFILLVCPREKERDVCVLLRMSCVLCCVVLCVVLCRGVD